MRFNNVSRARFNAMLLGGVAGLLLFESAANAQIETVVVTAEKTAGSVQSTPAAITALTSDQLTSREIDNVAGLQMQDPSLMFSTQQNGANVTIRGVGLPVVTGDAEQGVASYIDGVYLMNPSMSNIALIDLDRVEVLRGPQGTLYGRSATGGAINYILKEPTDTFEGGITLGAGNFGSDEVTGYVSGPIVADELLGRLSGSINNQGPYVQNQATNIPVGAKHADTLRGTLLGFLGPHVTAKLTGLYYKDAGSYVFYETTQYAPPGSPDIPPFPRSEYDVGNPYHINQDTSPVSSSMAQALLGTIDDQFGEFDIKSITGFVGYKQHWRFDGDLTSNPPTVPGGSTGERVDSNQTFTEELNFTGAALNDWVKFVTGAYYLHQTASAESDFNETLPFFGLTFLDFTRDQRINSYAGFGQATVSLSDNVRVIGGLRISSETKTGIQEDNYAEAFHGFANTPCSVPGGKAYSLSFSSFTPKAEVEYNPDSDSLIYALYQKGNKPGGINIDTCGNVFPAEKIDSFEIGAKNSFLNDTLTLNGSIFYYNYTNEQTLVILPISATIEGVPQSDEKGLETQLQYQPDDRFSANAGITILDGRVNKFLASDVTYPQPIGCNQYYPLGGGVPCLPQSLAGSHMVFTPTFTGTLGAQYKWPVSWGEIKSFTFRGEVYYNSGYFFNVFNRPINSTGSFALGNIYANLAIGDRYELRAFVKNVGNKTYVATGFDNPNGTQGGVYDMPRTFGIEGSVEF